MRPLPIRTTRRGFLGSVAVLSALTLLCGCTPTDRFVAGQPIGREELASISEALLATEPVEPSDGDTSAESYPTDAVYWTEGGSVYHLDPACYHLSRADEVLHGTVEKALAAGKDKVCASCGDNEDD